MPPDIAGRTGHEAAREEIPMSVRIVSVVAIALWLTTATAAVVFFVRGQTQVAPDGRTAVLLSPDERNLVLAEMRGILGSVQGVVDGGDMKRVAQAARAGGMAAAADVNPTLMAKLPLEFKQLGLGLHRRFDDIARAADSGASREQILAALSTQLSACVGCHEAYRLDAVSAPLK
jgi:hypothetical protein